MMVDQNHNLTSEKRSASVEGETQLISFEENVKKTVTSRRDAIKLGFFSAIAAMPLAPVMAAERNRKVKHSEDHPSDKASSHSKSTEGAKYNWLKPEEILFLEAAADRLIPADEKFGGAAAAGVTNYIDKQLGGRWGAGERLYRSGPWLPGTPEQGYQLPFTPAELIRNALAAINKNLAITQTPFHKRSESAKDDYLRILEKSDEDLGGVPAKLFFATLLSFTMEGFFSDPVYGGNKDMLSWKMLGFPGAGASYLELVDKHGIKLNRAPLSLAQDAGGHMHMNPNISAESPKVNN